MATSIGYDNTFSPYLDTQPQMNRQANSYNYSQLSDSQPCSSSQPPIQDFMAPKQKSDRIPPPKKGVPCDSSVKWCDTMTETLIEEVRKHAVLYDTNSASNKDRDERTKAWRAVAAALRINDPDYVKKKWENLLSCYRREKRDAKRPSRSGAVRKSTWKWYGFMTFLQAIPEAQSSQSSYDDDVEDDQHNEEQSGLFLINISFFFHWFVVHL